MVYGEKCTKFFLNLQYRNTNKNNLQKLVTEDGVIYDSPNYILKEESNYFRQMFCFPSHPLPLNEDYGKELFPNNIKKWKINKCAERSVRRPNYRGITF